MEELLQNKMVSIQAEVQLLTGACSCTWWRNMPGATWQSWHLKCMPWKLTEKASRLLLCSTVKKNMSMSRSERRRITLNPGCRKEFQSVNLLSNLPSGGVILNGVLKKQQKILRLNTFSGSK